MARESPEFVGLDSRQTARALDAGRRILKLAGIEPPGFIAPAYAYTPALRESLRTRFAWWAGAWGLHPTRAGATRQVCAPPIGLAAAGPLRIDVHPLDLASAGHMLALEDVIRRATPGRVCVTYDDLAAAA